MNLAVFEQFIMPQYLGQCVDSIYDVNIDYVPEESPDTSYEKNESSKEKSNVNPLKTSKEGYNE